MGSEMCIRDSLIYIWLYPLETNCLLYTLPTNDVLDNVRQNSKTWWFPITQVRIIARSSIVIMHPRKTIIHWSVTINTDYRTLSYVNKILIRPLIYLPMWLLDCWINESYFNDAIPFLHVFSWSIVFHVFRALSLIYIYMYTLNICKYNQWK